VRIASRHWTAAQAEHLTELIDAGWTAASAAVVLNRSVIVVRAKARNLGKTFLVITSADDVNAPLVSPNKDHT
jgi:hypothetical protein